MSFNRRRRKNKKTPGSVNSSINNFLMNDVESQNSLKPLEPIVESKTKKLLQQKQRMRKKEFQNKIKRKNISQFGDSKGILKGEFTR